MGKPTKRQARKQYNYSTNRRKEWKKSKKLPDIKCKEIKESWDRRLSVARNLADMGLSANPNKTIHIKSAKELITPIDLDDTGKNKEPKGRPVKEHVVQSLEKDASRPSAKTNKLSEPDVLFCTYMLDKHGDDFKAMARDPKNHYQETSKQIKKKINMFKNTPTQYEAYLKSKVDDAWGTFRKVCCSPVTAELRDGPPTSHSPRKRRRITRKYEAARRNGHYTQSPEVLDKDSTVESPPVTLSRVRRKLHFGRKPPKIRENVLDS
ncbi:nucleolar protein 16-like [Mercenaria mercenaria]|uniref:nucleolar protein 16-like n=1 Tax=Mercenaria mercenaria TaxID=6596 RepID=UPI00234EC387|nr:nucleolar protein 16-like [Mercenaria mercenaria]